MTRPRAKLCWRRCRRLPSATRHRRLRSRSATSAKSYGGIHAVDGVSLALPEGRFHAIIGPNGAGKSTFLRLLAREESPDSGQILLHGTDIAGADVTAAYQYGMAKSYQINQLFPQLTVRQNLRIGALGRQRGRLRLDIFRSAEGFAKVEAVVAALARRARPRRLRRPCRQHAALWREAPARARAGAGVAAVGAAARRAARRLEPRRARGRQATDPQSRKGRTIILVEHDMDAVFELAERITVLHEGRKLAEGTPKEISNDPRVKQAYLGGMAACR